MMDSTTIYSRLQSDYQLIEEMGYTPLMVAARGSMNYGLMGKDSDIDTIAVIIPSLSDIAREKKLISTTLILSSGEHIDIKDIRRMHSCYKK